MRVDQVYRHRVKQSVDFLMGSKSEFPNPRENSIARSKNDRGLAPPCILEFGILSVIPVLEPAADSLFIRVHLCDPLVKLISDCAWPGRLLSFGLDRFAGLFQNSGELRSESGRRPLLPMGFFFSFRPAIAGVIHWEKEERFKLC